MYFVVDLRDKVHLQCGYPYFVVTLHACDFDALKRISDDERHVFFPVHSFNDWRRFFWYDYRALQYGGRFSVELGARFSDLAEIAVPTAICLIYLQAAATDTMATA